MTRAIVLTQTAFRLPQLDLLRRAIVMGCPLALILAGKPLPF